MRQGIRNYYRAYLPLTAETRRRSALNPGNGWVSRLCHDPRDQQAITVCFAIEHRPGEDHTIDKPRQYELWRDYRPPGWPGPLLGWTPMRPETHEPLTRRLFEAEDGHPWWRFRRILDRTNFAEGFAASDITVVNWPQNDYWFGPVCGVDPFERERNPEAARQLSLSLLYWLQTEAPRPDGGLGYPGLRLRGDAMGSVGIMPDPWGFPCAFPAPRFHRPAWRGEDAHARRSAFGAADRYSLVMDIILGRTRCRTASRRLFPPCKDSPRSRQPPV